MKRLINFVPSMYLRNSPKQHETEDSNKYYSIAVRFFAECACEEIQKLEPKLHLSTKPPAYLETARRFLWYQAPHLPFPKCTLEHSVCHYVHHSDRRQRDRRHRYDDLKEGFDPGYVGLERRAKRDRRRG